MSPFHFLFKMFFIFHTKISIIKTVIDHIIYFHEIPINKQSHSTHTGGKKKQKHRACYIMKWSSCHKGNKNLNNKITYGDLFSLVQFSPVTQLCPTLCDPMHCSTPGFLLRHQLPEFLKLMSIELVMPSNHLIPSVIPFSSCLQSLPASVISNESALHIRWPKYWSFSFSISPSNEYSGLVSFRIDSLELLAVQGTLKTPLQHHSSKASILQHSTFSMVHLSHSHMITGKTIAWTRWTFVSKVMSLLFNMLSRLVIAFLPRSKHLFISWLQSLSAEILEPKKIKPVTVSIASPSICCEVMGPDAMIFVF